MARIPPSRCGRTDRGDSTAWDDSNDDVCPRQQTSSDAYPHAYHANTHTYHHTAYDHDDVAAEWKRVYLLIPPSLPRTKAGAPRSTRGSLCRARFRPD